MSFDQEYTIYFLQGSVFGLSGNKQCQIPSGNEFVYSFTKLMIFAVYPLRKILGIVLQLLRRHSRFQF